jgi:hypothetical protein
MTTDTYILPENLDLAIVPFSDAPEVSDEEAAREFGISLITPEDDENQPALLTPNGYFTNWPTVEIEPFIDETTRPQRAPFKLPDDVLEVLRQCGDDISQRKWSAGRLIVSYLSDLPEQKRNALRADVIKQSAAALQVDEAVVREWVHTCEIMPEGIEDMPRYREWGFSLFARAARMGEGDLAIAVLEIARERNEQYNPGTPPPCWVINQIVKEQKARLKGATDDELEALREEAMRRARFRFSGRVARLASLDRLVVIVPEDTDILEGDDVTVFKKVSKD